MQNAPVHHSPEPGFLQLEDLISDQGDVTLVIEYDSRSPYTPQIVSYSCLSLLASLFDIALCYFEASSLNLCTSNLQLASKCDRVPLWQLPRTPAGMDTPLNTPLATFVAKKKYKLVTLKVRPVLGTLPSQFRIERNITSNPLADILTLPPIPLPFESHSRYTQE